MSATSGKPATWQAHIITLFPDMFPGPLNTSLSGRALETGAWACQPHDLRAFGEGRHRAVDDTPAGGGAGMVLRADIASAALADTQNKAGDLPVLLPSPRGVPFTQELAADLALGKGAIFMCNRFEGVDERFIEAHNLREVSMGDYILSGGELATQVILDSCIRLLPGVMGNKLSHEQESFENGLLEHPNYTQPRIWQGIAAPEVLSSGHHEKIASWRKSQSEDITKERRPDLWQDYLDNK